MSDVHEGEDSGKGGYTTDTAYDFTGLNPSTKYTVSVQGRKGIEAGPAATADTKTKTKLDKPQAPVLKKGTKPTSTGFQVQWPAVQHAKGYSGMVVKPGENAPAEGVTFSVDQPLTDPVTATVTGADPATEYDVTVAATGDDTYADSDASTPSRFRTAAGDKPAAPGKPQVDSATAPTKDTIVVTFAKSATEGATYDKAKQTIKKSDGSGDAIAASSVDASADPVKATFTGLAANTGYKVTAVASKDGQDSDPSPASDEIKTAANGGSR